MNRELMEKGKNQTEVAPRKKSNRTSLVLAGGLMFKSLSYLLSGPCVLSYLWLSLGAALL